MNLLDKLETVNKEAGNIPLWKGSFREFV
ncbi:hypothetical protein LCGC14_2510670, partial [marine sediment metagenome]